MCADTRMDPQPTELNVALFLGEMNSFVSFPFLFIFAFSFLGLPNFPSQLWAWPLFFPCSWSKHKILEFLLVSASLGVCVLCVYVLRHFCIGALLVSAALVLDAFDSQSAPVLCVRLLLKAVRCLCASLYCSRSKNKLVGDKSTQRGNKCSRYVRWQMFLGMIKKLSK